MKIIEISGETEFGVLTEATLVLKSGGILVLPTDTTYGLAADATKPEAVKKIFSLKARKENNPLPVFVDSFKMLDEVACVKSEKVKKFLEAVWPGKITCVLPARGWMPIETRGGGGLTIGVRMPDFGFLNFLMKSFGKPITGTSANISGKGSYLDIQDVINDFKHMPFKPDLILSAGALPESNVSTVVDLTNDEPKILRKGAVGEDEIRKIWEKIS